MPNFRPLASLVRKENKVWRHVNFGPISLTKILNSPLASLGMDNQFINYLIFNECWTYILLVHNFFLPLICVRSICSQCSSTCWNEFNLCVVNTPYRGGHGLSLKTCRTSQICSSRRFCKLNCLLAFTPFLPIEINILDNV